MSFSKKNNNESNYNNAEKPLWDCGSIDLLIDLLNIPRHANKETQGLRQESAEYISERLYRI